MPEMRRPSNSPSGQSSRSHRRGPAPKRTPMWLKIGLILAPIILIALVWNLKARRTSEENAEVVIVDPNDRIKKLEAEVSIFDREAKVWMRLQRAEDPEAESKGEELIARMEKWMDEWDTIFEARRDAQGNLPTELQGYSRIRANFNLIRSDVLKASGSK